MTWESYGSFVLFAAVLVVVPGPDFAVVTKNALSAGRRSGVWASLGVTTSNAVQGAVAAVGLGALIVASQPLFTAIRWAGVAYLGFLGVQALRSAWRGRYAVPGDANTDSGRRLALTGWRQGFLSNITNPKVLIFYLAVLPQFLPAAATVWEILPLALTHALLGLAYLLLLVVGLHQARRVLVRRAVRRGLDAVTGVVLLGFGARLARDQG
ncbi:MAG: LysE family translocator [Nocardioidaceae bacterium]|jgi:threonine/homoserine/homoserine lactone efflux protein|nr:LysE family translocator [Nocardioidaceae bacterium]